MTHYWHYILLAPLLLSFSALADITPANLPHIQSTPLAELNENGDHAWSILDYQQGDDELKWVWLQNGIGDNAYVVYSPADVEEAYALPNGQYVESMVGRIKLAFWGNKLSLTFTPFAGKVTVVGTHVTADLPDAEIPTANYNLAFTFTSIESINIEATDDPSVISGTPADNAAPSIALSANGGIIAIRGGAYFDSLRGLSSNNEWTLDGPNNGTYRSIDRELTTSFTDLEMLIGGPETDTFIVNSPIETQIIAEGMNHLIVPSNDDQINERSDICTIHDTTLTYNGGSYPEDDSPCLSSDNTDYAIVWAPTDIEVTDQRTVEGSWSLSPETNNIQLSNKKKGGASQWLLLITVSLLGLFKRYSHYTIPRQNHCEYAHNHSSGRRQ